MYNKMEFVTFGGYNSQMFYITNLYFSNVLIPTNVMEKIRVIYFLSPSYFSNGCAYDTMMMCSRMRLECCELWSCDMRRQQYYEKIHNSTSTIITIIIIITTK